MTTERKLKITDGPWELRDSDIVVDGTRIAVVLATWRGFDSDQANAEFIAEAGTVANECDLMPRELLAQRDELARIATKIIQMVDEGYEESFILHGTGDVMVSLLAAISRVRGQS